MLLPNATPAVLAALEDKVLRATNAMNADAVLSWTNTGLPRRRLRLRRQQPTRITGRHPRVAQLALIDADYRKLSAVENAPAAVPAGQAIQVINAGNELATPRFELVGPYPGPIRVENMLTGLSIRLKASFALAAGQVLSITIAPPWPIVTVNGVDAYGQVDFLPTSWWGLVPGPQQIRALGGGQGATFRPRWRDAWI
jgi:hypothetical protein